MDFLKLGKRRVEKDYPKKLERLAL